MEKACSSIGLLTFPIGETGIIPLSNLVDIACQISNEVYLITGDEGYEFFKEDKRIKICCGLQHIKGTKAFTRILRYIYTQLIISYDLAKISKYIDLWIFFIGAEGLLLPILTAKLLRKKLVMASASSGLKVAQAQKDRFTNVIALLQDINYHLSDKIILHSPILITEWNLEKYKSKILISHEYFLNFDNFKMKKNYDQRDCLVGYIGTLSKAKGIPNLLEAIPKVLEQKNKTEFLIGGGGNLHDHIEQYLSENNLKIKVRFVGWIPHDEITTYLNELKLLVIPTYTESGPIIALEAMSCGTPILATRVGHVLNMIEDGKTGFIMENNSPECIARNIIRVLNCPNINDVIKNAHALIEKEFTYEAAVEKYELVLKSI